MRSIILKRRPNYKKEEFKYNRVDKTKKYQIKIDAEDYEERATNYVRSAIDEMLSRE